VNPLFRKSYAPPRFSGVLSYTDFHGFIFPFLI
jgi:hypothetical protein